MYKYCCNVWGGAPSCYLEMLDNLQKQVCRTVSPPKKTLNFMAPFYGWGSTVSRLQNHYEEKVFL